MSLKVVIKKLIVINMKKTSPTEKEKMKNS